MASDSNRSEMAFQEIVQVLERAVQSGVDSLGLEYKGRELLVFHQTGALGVGVERISDDLRQQVIQELVRRAGLLRKERGKFRVVLLGRDFEILVEEHDSFGESAFNLTLRERQKKAGE
jgi:hypothetical protein